jgi:hypothetical protein
VLLEHLDDGCMNLGLSAAQRSDLVQYLKSL